MSDSLREVKEFWEKNSCGEALYLGGHEARHYQEQSSRRYELEPYIEDLAGFGAAREKTILEIGVGLGADHQRFGEAGTAIFGMDLTRRSIDHVRDRFRVFGLKSFLLVGDAQALPYRSESFDMVYSWGVIHHAPSPKRILEEVYRILKPGADLRVMIYHKWSMVGFMLWLRYGLFRLKPWTSLGDLYARHLESPGTKAYSRAEARKLFYRFGEVEIRTILTHGDLLTSAAGQRHQGMLLDLARRIWPRWLIRSLFPGLGLFMLVRARKPLSSTER